MKCYTLTILLLLTLIYSYGQNKYSYHEKALKFITRIKEKGKYPAGGHDTLIDLNCDNYKDILIEFYSQSGTGLKNGIQVYLYNILKNKFQICEQLNYLANPTFYLKKRIVVGYYLGNGGGDAIKLKWNGMKLDTLEYIKINVINNHNNVMFLLSSFNYITKRKSYKALNEMSLPKEYNFMKYEPIIKNK